MQSSHQFDPDAFLQPFEGREEMIEAYLDTLPAGSLTIPRPVSNVLHFRNHLETCSPGERKVLTPGLIEAWEMSSDEGHEQLMALLRTNGGCDASHTSLPAECLALHLLSTNRELFECALTLDQVRRCDALEMFKPNGSVQLVSDLDASTLRFRDEIAARCGEKFGSRRVLVKRFGDPNVFTLGFYFEKLPKARRSLGGTESNPHLAREEDRPLQFDALLFEPTSGVLSVRSGWGRLTEPIRKSLAKVFLQRPDAFEWDGASQILELSEFFGEEELLDVDGRPPMICDLEYAPTHDEFFAKYRVTGADVLSIIRRDGNVNTVRNSSIRRLVVKMALEHSARRRRRVVLTAPNKVDFKRGTEAGRLVAQLRDWNVLQAPTSVSLPA